MIINSSPIILPRKLRKCEKDDYNNTNKNNKKSNEKKLSSQTTQIYEYVNFKQEAYITFEFQIEDAVFANGFYFLLASNKTIYCREFDSDTSQPKYFCSYSSGLDFESHWKEFGDKKTMMSGVS